MLDAALTALQSFADPTVFLYLMVGVFGGLIMGVLPGLGGTAAVGILLPFVIVLPPQHSLPILIGAVAVVHHSDVISATLLAVPGSASAAVILHDSNAMARKGKAARAFSICFMSAMFGGLIGAIGLTFSIPIAKPLVLSFASPELFMLTILGISMAALLSQGNMLKGLVGAALGILIGTIGGAPAAAVYRFSFGIDSLLGGVGLIPLALGFFGLAEIAHMIARKAPIADRIVVGGGWLEGVRETFQHWVLILRGALVGMWAGVLPGLGATAGTYMAYGQAVATAGKEERKKFGKGDPRGLVAAESAVNSLEAGDLVPTLLFGIPGGAPAALLLGALLAYGIQPGPTILTQHLDVMYTIIWSYAIASVIGSIFCFFLAKPLARLSFIPFQYLAPALLLVMFVAAFQTSGNFGALVIMLVLGILGYIMKIADYPRAPLLIGFVLCEPMERYYFLTTQLYSWEWVTRPYVLVMYGILVLPFVWAIVQKIRSRRSPETASKAAASEATKSSTGGEVDEETDYAHSEESEVASTAETQDLGKSIWPFGLGIVVLVLFIGALAVAHGYPYRARLMPYFISAIGVVVTSLFLIREGMQIYRKQRTASCWSEELVDVSVAFGWLILFIALAYFLGFVVATAIYVPLFLWLVSRMRLLRLLAYSAAAVAILVIGYKTAVIDLPGGLVLPVIPFV